MKSIKTKAMMTKVANRIEADVKEALSIYTHSVFNVVQNRVGDRFKEIRISRGGGYHKFFTPQVMEDCIEIECRYGKQYRGVALSFEAQKEPHYEGAEEIGTITPCIVFTIGLGF